MTSSVPVGAILAYAADDISAISSQDWLPCDGRLLSRDDYPELFSAITWRNGGTKGDPTFALPDLRGYFMRGTSGATAVVTPYLTGSPVNPFTASMVNLPTGSHKGNDGASGPGADDFLTWQSGSTQTTLLGFDKESRPINVAFIFVIKVTSTPDVSTGIVAPFANSTEPSSNWLLCNGNTISQSQASTLYSVIGKRFGSSATLLFSLPNLQGQFLRGLDDGTGRDPDLASRKAPDGSVGNFVGTNQSDGTGTPNHSDSNFVVQLAHYPTSTHKEFVVNAISYNCVVNNNQHGATLSGGDNETRPANLSMDYYIQMSPDTTVPIGLVIAFSGTSAPDPDYWTLCDGSAVPTTGPFADLFAGIGTMYGTPGDGQFNLPNLQNNIFIRGTDYTGAGQPGFDPDRTKRTASAPGGATSGPGSLQQYATALPAQASISASMATDSRPISKTAVGTDFSAWTTDTYKSNFSTANNNDGLTKPLSFDVNFYIKYA